MPLTIRRATIGDVDTIVRILIRTKEESFPGSVDEHERDEAFWTRRWHGYIKRGSRARQSLGDGFVFIAEQDGAPVGYAAYHHTQRFDTDAELQNIYVLKASQRRGIGTRLLAVVAHRLVRDGSRTMCVGFDGDSPYRQFYTKHGAEIDGAWAIWRDVRALAGRLPSPEQSLLDDAAPVRRRAPWWAFLWMR